MLIETTPAFAGLKARMKATWMAGDFGQVAKYAEHEAAKFISRQNIKPVCECSTSPAEPTIWLSQPSSSLHILTNKVYRLGGSGSITEQAGA